MKNLLYTIYSVLITSFLFSSAVFSQSHEGFYMHIDYLNVDNSMANKFESDVTDYMKPVQQARIDAEILKAWYIYRVAYPGTQNTFYNYVLITISDDISSFEDIRSQIRESYSSEEADELLEEYHQLMIPNHSELWRINNSVLSSDDAKPSRYFGMDYMKVRPGMEYAYQMMEDEEARPVHETRMEIGTMKGWELFSLITPGGTEYGYNFATGNYYNYLKNIEFGFTEEVIRRSHPETNINEFFENIDRTRDLVRSEIWELVDYVK
jgi:hypothetical protein